jgi:hypothetical protein
MSISNDYLLSAQLARSFRALGIKGLGIVLECALRALEAK